MTATESPAAVAAPAPESAIYAAFVIPRVVAVFRPKAGPAFDFESDRSNVVLARLFTAAAEGERLVCLSHAGREADADSVAALNCFLRAGRAMGRMRHPWHRLPRRGLGTKFEWRELIEHLGLSFA